MSSQEHVGRNTGRGVPSAVVRTYNVGQELVPVVHMAGANNAQHLGQRTVLSFYKSVTTHVCRKLYTIVALNKRGDAVSRYPNVQ